MKKLLKYILLISTLLSAALFASCRLIVTLNPYEQSFIGILGLLTPVLMVINLLFLLVWLVARKWLYCLIPIASFIISWNVFSVAFGGHFFSKQSFEKTDSTFTLMSYNVRLLDLYKWSKEKDTRERMLHFLKEQNPTVLCIQEFYNGNDSIGVNNIKSIQDSCNYPYYAECNLNVNKRGKWGSIIFSHLPIVSTENHDIDVSGSNMLQQANIAFQKDTFSVFNIHLKSNRFTLSESELVGKKEIPVWDEKTINESKSIYNKLEKSTINRGLEADLVSNVIQHNRYPSLVCGDLNDIPSSYAYFKMRSTKLDAFLTKGAGLGATYNQAIPLLRIDYIFYDPAFTLQGFQKFDVTYSDHYPILANFSVN